MASQSKDHVWIRSTNTSGANLIWTNLIWFVQRSEQDKSDLRHAEENQSEPACSIYSTRVFEDQLKAWPLAPQAQGHLFHGSCSVMLWPAGGWSHSQTSYCVWALVFYDFVFCLYLEGNTAGTWGEPLGCCVSMVTLCVPGWSPSPGWLWKTKAHTWGTETPIHLKDISFVIEDVAAIVSSSP